MKLGTILSLLVGFGAGYMVAREVYKSKINDITQQMIDEQRKMKEKMQQKEEELVKNMSNLVYGTKSSDISDEKSEKNDKKPKNYKEMYVRVGEKPEGNIKFSDKIENLDDYEDKNEESAVENETVEELVRDQKQLELMEKIDRERDLDPIVITEEEIGDITEGCYDEELLFYYVLNDTLTDEYDEPVEDEYELIGNCIDESGILNVQGVNREIIVQNFKLQIIYRVRIFEREYVMP